MTTLYHFTSDSFLPSIQKDGIWRGDVPTSSDGGFNAPWLTSDGSWSDQGWADGGPLDKSQVRLTVQVPTNDAALELWATLARELGVDPQWYAALDASGGGGSAAWHVYRGRIPWSWVTRVEHRPRSHQTRTRQDLARGWGSGKTGVSRNTAPTIAQRLSRIAQGNGEKPPLFATGKLDMTDKALHLLSPSLDADVEPGELDPATMMLVRHVGNPPTAAGLATIQEAEGIVFRVVTTFEPEHKTTIMLADEA